MGTFSDFLRQHTGAKARVRRLYWVCGEELVLRNLTVAYVQEMYGALPYNTFRLSARDSSESEIWAMLNQHPLDSEQRRLLIVSDAEYLEHLDRLEAWLKENQSTRNKNACAIFVAAEPELSSTVKDLLAASSSAQYVRCTLPKAPEDRLKRMVDLIVTWGNITPVNAHVLAEHVGMDLYEARAVMDKANFFHGAAVTVPAIKMLAAPKAAEEVVWNLIAGNKRAAATALTEDSEPMIGSVIGSLTTHVEMLGRINPLVAAPNFTIAGAARRLGARQQYVRMLSPHARLYPPDEVDRRVRLLCRLDHLYQEGAREGVLEALVAAW